MQRFNPCYKKVYLLFEFGQNQKVNLSLFGYFLPGNETNYKTKWGAISQKKVGKCTEY